MDLLRRLQRKQVFYWLKKTKKYVKVQGRLIQPKENYVFMIEEDNPELIMEFFSSVSDQILAGFQQSDSVLVKINTNSSFPYPASTSCDFLAAFVTFLRKHGFNRITVGDCASNRFLPSKRVFKELGLKRCLLGKADLVAFEDKPYVEVNVNGHYLKSARISRCAFDFDKVINLTNMKTHCLAGYSLAMKNLIGFLHPLDRKALHENHLQEKIAEISLCIQPDLNIIDARRFFISGGPDQGEVAVGNTVLVSNDLLTIDVEAYKRLFNWKLEAGDSGEFDEDPYNMPQISHYAKLEEKLTGWRKNCK